MHYKSLIKTLFALLTPTLTQPAIATPAPATPHLSYLYTAFVLCSPSIYEMQTPTGIQKAIPIIGGNFTGPRLHGKILDLGADWGSTDPQTGIFSANTRYNLQTHDGANLFLQTSGPKQENGELHLKIDITTGDKRYYWLNNIVAFGTLHNVGVSEEGISTLRIDAWHMAGEWNSTTFVNGTTY